jgi:hypothetical protein
MPVRWFRLMAVALVGVAAASLSIVPGGAQSQAPVLPLGPNRNAGEAVTAAFEGWFYRPDGSVNLLVGYFNRNLKQVLDIPVGPNNRIEPGGPDYGQPTHFLPRRQWGVFTIPVPKDFGDRKLTWTIVANGFTTSIPLSVHKQYQVEPYEEKGMGNTPPILRFEPGGATYTGPPIGIAATLAATAGEPLTLPAWVTDKPAKITVDVPRPAAAAETRPGVDVERSPRTGRGDVRRSETRDRQGRGRQDDDHGHFQRAWGLHSSRAGERHVRRRRRRVSVLLDQRARQGLGQGDGHQTLITWNAKVAKAAKKSLALLAVFAFNVEYETAR